MKDKNTISELYENYIDDIYSNTIEKSKYTDKIKRLEKELDETLTKEQKDKQEEINTYYQKRNEEVFKNIWKSAYSLATKLIIEGLKE